MYTRQEATNTKIELDNGEEGGKVSFSGSACSHAAGKEEHNYSLEVIHDCLLLPFKACSTTIIVARLEFRVGVALHWIEALIAIGVVLDCVHPEPE